MKKQSYPLSFYCIFAFDFLITAYALLCIILSLLAPLLDIYGYESISVREGLSPTCHQMTSRSFSFYSYPAGICVRCMAVYSGIIFFRLFLKINKKGFIETLHPALWKINTPPVIIFLLGQMCIDWALGYSGIISFSFFRVFISGFLFGGGWIFGPHIYIIRFIRVNISSQL